MIHLIQNLDCLIRFLIKGLAVLFFVFFFNCTQSIQAQTRLIDSITLVQLYQDTNGPGWTNTWDLTLPMDTWHGVFVDYFSNPGGRVTCLDLDGFSSCASSGTGGNNLTGQLNDLRLTECQYLYLSGNNLSGNIPNFSNLPQLIRMNLQGNSLSGTIPDFQAMDFLTDIRLEGNQLTGSIPNFSGVPSLNNLRLLGNQLTGPIPDFTSIPNIVDIVIHTNNLTGSIPNFSNTPVLETFYVQNNQLSGSLPDFVDVPSLRIFDASRNQLTGTIPDYPSGGSLVHLSLQINQLSGSIPDFPNAPSLIRLEIHNNQLTGPIPDFSNTPSLQDLYFYNNQLSGGIPNFSNIPAARYLFLYNNRLVGPIPGFTNMPGLWNISLHTNGLTGTIPDWNLPDLQDIHLSDNRLTGAIPNFANLPSLLYLKVARNDLDLPVPTFSNFSILFTLDLTENQLTFEDLVSSAAANQTIANNGGYDYKNQDSIGVEQTITLPQGSSYTIDLNIDNNLTTSIYNWYKDGTFLTSTTINSLTINNFQQADQGNYYCLVDNPDAPLLTLTSRTTTLLLESTCAINQISIFPECGTSTGIINITINGGNPPYNFNWNNGATTEDLINITPGTYTVSVSDLSGNCSTTKSATISPAGEPVIEWERSYGGTLNENAESISYTSDGHILVSGRSFSSNGDVGLNKGNSDFWIIKTDSLGNLLGSNTWKTVLGGSDEDYALDHKETADGGVIVAGYTFSSDQDVVGFHGAIDTWVVKLSSTGTLEWQNAIGGSNSEIATSIEQTPDGGYIVGGYSNSTDGDRSQSFGNVDYWVVKLNASGGIEWERSYGGSAEDNMTSIEIAPTGGYFLGGFTYSNDGDIQGANFGLADYWVVHIDNAGNIIWSRTFGGPFEDKLNELKVLPDGGLGLIGWSNSNTGQISNNKGGKDVWFVKTDPTGNLQFQNSLGTSNDDEGQYIISTDDHAYLITGYTDTTEFDVTGNHGEYDYWVAKLDHSGQLDWQKSLGGTGEDFGFACDVAGDGGYLIAGWSNSKNGDVTGNNGDEDFWVVKLNDNYPITTSMMLQDVSCFGGNNGHAVIAHQGGTPPFTYIWNTGSTLDSIGGLVSGNYAVSVYDNNFCRSSHFVFIGQPPAASLTFSILTTSQCDLACSAEASVTVSGNGTPPFTYLWDNGNTTQVASALCAGYRYVTVTDFEGCTIGIDSIFIHPISGLNPTINETKSISCVPGNDGIIRVTATGNNLPLSYLWNNGNTIPSISNLSEGTYIVTVSDAEGCSSTAQYILSDPLPLSVFLSPFSTSCPGGSDGSIMASPGGQLPYSYLWSNGAQSATISNLTAGNYSVTVIDNTGCLGTATTAIVDGSGTMISTIAKVGTNCFDSIAVLDLEVSGGVLPYSYIWSNGTTTTSIEDLTIDTSGVYLVTITDGVGCTVNDSEIIFFSEEIMTTITINDSVSCSGNTDGIATVTASAGAGSGDFLFEWSNGFNDNTSYTFTSTATGLSPGSYTVTITDLFTIDSCKTVVSFNMPSAGGITSNAYVSSPILCNGGFGNVDVSISGGTPPYSYIWSNGATTQAALLVSANTYLVTVVDDNDCSDVSSVTITQPDSLTVSATTTNATCNSASGSITINASGGYGGVFFYTIDGGGTLSTSSTFNTLFPGIYDAMVIDSFFCSKSIQVTVGNASGVQIDSLQTDPAICGASNGTITVFASQGALLQYSLDGNNYQSSNIFNNLPIGQYDIIALDSFGCMDTTQTTIFTTTSPTIDSVSQTNPSCQSTNGSFSIFASGGAGPLEYSLDSINWQTASFFLGQSQGVYSVYVRDNNSCLDSTLITLNDLDGPTIDSTNILHPHCQGLDGTITVFASGGTGQLEYSLDSLNWQTQIFWTGLPQSTYTIYVRDINLCMATTIVTLTDLAGPSIDSIRLIQPICNSSNGTITVFGSGGFGTIEFKLDNGIFQAQNFFSGLPQGTYTAYIRDANDCQDSILVSLSDSGSPFIDSIQKTQAGCGLSNGSMLIYALGGNPPYEFSINNSTFQTDSTFNNLSAGSYNISVRDALNCTVTVIDSLIDLPPPSIDSVNTGNSACQGASGSVTIFASGIPPISYSIDGVNYVPSNIFGNVATGSYDVIVFDGNNCSDTLSIIVSNTDGPTLDSLNISNPVCQGSNGSITIFATGGTAPLEYSLDNTSYIPSNTFTTLSQGVYSVYVRDNNGCIDSTQTTLSELTGPTIDSINTTSANCGNSDGSLTIFSTSGTAPVTYSLNGGTPQQNNQFSGLAATTYTIEVSDVNGCSQTATATINNLPWNTTLDLTIAEGTCGQQNGSIVITPPTGNSPFLYSIDNGATTTTSSLFTGLAPGPYHVWIEDMIGCTVDSMINLVSINPPVIDSLVVTDAVCNLDNGEITVYTSAGTAPFEYSIDNGITWQPSSVFDSLAAGSYTITVRDSNSCVLTETTTLTNSLPPTFGFLQGVSPANCGQADGRIVIFTGFGGTLPFEFSIDSGLVFQVSDTFPNLLAGIYNAVIKDANGCEVHKPLVVTDSPGPNLQSSNIQEPACGMPSGSVSLSPSGTEFEYNINSGTFTSNNVFNGLIAGQHSFIIVNTLTNCSDTLLVTLTDQPGPTIASTNVQQSSCGNSNGSISISTTSGLPPFTYSIDNGVNWQNSPVFTGLSANTFQIIVEDSNTCRDTSQLITISNPGSPVINSVNIEEPACNQYNGIATVNAMGGNPPLLYSLDGVNFQISNIFTNLATGAHTIYVFDSTACQTDTVITLGNLTGPSLDSIFIDDPDCNMSTGIIELFGSGGNPPYQYSIDNGATFSNNNQFNNLVASTYLVVIKDDRDCEITSTAVLQNQLGPQIDSLTITPADCISNTGALTVLVSGGNMPYSYVWNTVPAQIGMTATALPQGQYIVTITDDNNCSSVATGVVPPPLPIQVNLGSDFAACGAFSQVLDAGPGNEYLWTTGDTTQNLLVATYGIYGVTLTDINNCISTDSIEIEEIPFNPTITSDSTILVGDVIQLEAGGGLNYDWWPGSDLSCVLCPDPVATPVDSVTYFVEISATNNCVDTLSVHVDQFNINNPVIQPPDVISDNGDGINDVWEIRDIEFYPSNRVIIVNRWGDVVYEAYPYQNDWSGTYKGQRLPQGTYYYYIELDVNRINTLRGSITILR